jgi:hypothetical protein
MFDLESRLTAWRRAMVEKIGDRRDVLDELEGHLREEMHRAALAGRPAEAAWDDAVRRLGSPEDLGREYAKLPEARPLRWAPAWIVAGLYLFLTSGLICPAIAKMYHGGATPLLVSHVAVVSAGYFAVFAFGLLSTWLTLSRLWGGATLRRTACLRWWGRAFALVAFVGCVLGFILGGLWARNEFGMFWTNDPREYGALVLIAWQAFVLAIYGRQRTPTRLDLALGIAGNLVLGLCWFVAVLLAATWASPPMLHSYGGVPTWWTAFLVVYFAINFALLALALVPMGRRDSNTAEASV